jgi:hypothetical protein
MLTQTQFFNVLDAAITFFATLGAIVTVTSAVYALNAMRWVTLSNRSSWEVLALAVNIGIVEGFQLGIPVAVLQLVLSRQWLSS